MTGQERQIETMKLSRCQGPLPSITKPQMRAGDNEEEEEEEEESHPPSVTLNSDDSDNKEEDLDFKPLYMSTPILGAKTCSAQLELVVIDPEWLASGKAFADKAE